MLTTFFLYLFQPTEKATVQTICRRLIENWKQSLANQKFVRAVLVDFSKVFDCVPHNFLIAKMHAYGFSIDSLKIFFSYLKGRKQYVKINNTYSVFQVLLSGVPEESILDPILFNIFINDLLFWIENAELHNFTDDNTISYTEKSLEELIKSLTSESEKAVQWFKETMMIVNRDNFQAIIIGRKNQLNNPTSIKINDININSENSVRLLGLEIDGKLNFDKHITKLYQKSAGQLNALCRLKSFLNTNQRKILVNRFIYSSYNYCPPVWHFFSKKSMNKTERIQYRALQFIHNDYNFDYNTLLKKSDKCSMEVRRLGTVVLQIFVTLNNLNPSFINELFNKRSNINRRENDLIIYTRNIVMFGSNNLRCLSPHIWNLLPENIKESINNWYGPSSKCSLCYDQN